MTPVAADRPLTIRDATTMLGCSRSYLYGLVRKGVLPAQRLGTPGQPLERCRLRFRRPDIEALLQTARPAGATS